MATLPIRIQGDPVLHEPAAEVTEFGDDLRRLVDDMFETMDRAPGVGLAAPQVGVGKRLFVYSYKDDDGEPWRGVIINPELWITPTPAGVPDEDSDSEGCLSFPGERFPLLRAESAVARGVDVEQNPVELRVDGWRARILQHEFDHLNGTIYIDRLDSAYERILLRIIRKRGWGVPGRSWLPGEEHLEG